MAWTVVTYASTLRFGRRSVEEAAFGNPSLGNLVELGLYGLVAAACILGLVRVGQPNLTSGLRILLWFAGLGLLSALWSTIPLFSLARGLQLCTVSVLAIVTAEAWRQDLRDAKQDLTRIAYAVIWSGLILSIVGLVARTRSDGRFDWAGLTDPATVAGILAVGVVLCWWLRMTDPALLVNPLRRRSLFIVSVVFIVLVVATRSRAGLAGALFGWVCFLLLVPTAANRHRASLAGVALLTMAALLVVGDQAAEFGLRDQTIDEFLSFTGRVPLWEAAGRSIEESPVVGHGLGSSRLILSQDFHWAGTGHNLWIEVAIGLGVLGALLATAILGWLIVVSWSSRRNASQIPLLTISIVLMATVMSITETTIAMPGFWLACVSLLVALMSASGRRRSSATNQSTPATSRQAVW